MNLNDTEDEKAIIKIQSLLIQYFKPFHKKEMPDIVKQMLETINHNVRTLGSNNEASSSTGKFHGYKAQHSYAIITSLKTMTISNNTSAN